MLSSLLLAAIVWPAGAQIIERERVPSAKGPRELVLWHTDGGDLHGRRRSAKT